ncbi:MAG: hypothetical protein ACREOK_07910 [Gemmatimonadaceae bacterium]
MMRAKSSRCTFAALAMTAMLLNACTSWHPVSGSVPTAIGTTRADVYRVVLRDGRVLHLRGVRVANDSLAGIVRNAISSSRITPEESARGYAVEMNEVVKVAVADVRSLSVSRFNAGRTVLVVIAGVAVAFVMLAAAAVSSMELGFAGTY